MRRNTVTIIKYLAVVSLFLIMGPFLLKSLLQDDDDVDQFEQVPRGNPKIAQVLHKSQVSYILIIKIFKYLVIFY